MTIAVVELRWFQFRQKILDWWNEQRNDQLTKADRARDRSISILQKRYGYTREKAASDLDRYYSKARLG
jgi:hypothetical protein